MSAHEFFRRRDVIAIVNGVGTYIGFCGIAALVSVALRPFMPPSIGTIARAMLPELGLSILTLGVCISLRGWRSRMPPGAWAGASLFGGLTLILTAAGVLL